MIERDDSRALENGVISFLKGKYPTWDRAALESSANVWLSSLTIALLSKDKDDRQWGKIKAAEFMAMGRGEE